MTMKEYIKPETQIVALKYQQMLAASAPGFDSTEYDPATETII